MKLRHIFPIAIGLVAGGLHAGILTVINTNDSLAGSRRQAIQDAAPKARSCSTFRFGDPGYDPRFSNFRRNRWPKLAQYVSECPEIIS